MIKVLLADDQVLVREGFRAIIERDGGMQVVGEAGNGVDAVALCRQARPDVVLMDIRMPLLDELSATRQVLALPEPPKVLVRTAFDRNDWVYDALKSGASGFLLKDVRSGPLTEAIRTVFTGGCTAGAIDHAKIDRGIRGPLPRRSQRGAVGSDHPGS